MKSQVKRNELGQFLPGTSGNPAGRPRMRTPARIAESEAIAAARLAESRAFTSDIDVTIIDVASDMVSKPCNIIRRVPQAMPDTCENAHQTHQISPCAVESDNMGQTPMDAESDATGQKWDWTVVGSAGKGQEHLEHTYHTIDPRRGIIYELQRVQGWH